jgi:hypothetical protein
MQDEIGELEADLQLGCQVLEETRLSDFCEDTRHVI